MRAALLLKIGNTKRNNHQETLSFVLKHIRFVVAFTLPDIFFLSSKGFMILPFKLTGTRFLNTNCFGQDTAVSFPPKTKL